LLPVCSQSQRYLGFVLVEHREFGAASHEPCGREQIESELEVCVRTVCIEFNRCGSWLSSLLVG